MITFASIVAYIIGLLNQSVFVLGALAVVIFMWGMVKYVRDAAIGKRPKRDTMLWSLLALFVLFSVWGILRVMCTSFGNLCTSGTTAGPTNIVPAGGAYNYYGTPATSPGSPGGPSGLY